MIAPHPAEHVAVLQAHGYFAEAAAVYAIQHREGMAAHIDGAPYQDFRTAAWQQGWLDARELGAVAPLAWLRQDAEV